MNVDLYDLLKIAADNLMAQNAELKSELLDAREENKKLREELDEAREDATNYYAKIGDLESERDEAMEAAKLAYSILGKVNRPSLEAAAARSSIKHINDTPMDWLKSIVQKWEETK